MFAVNVKAPFFLVAELAPAMAKRGHGAIINVTTMVAEFGMGVALDADGAPPIALPTDNYALSDRTRRAASQVSRASMTARSRRSARLWAADNDLQPLQSLVSASCLAANLREDGGRWPHSRRAFNRQQPRQSPSLGERLKKGSLKKRSAARGAEGRARFMLWPTIAADRSLSR